MVVGQSFGVLRIPFALHDTESPRHAPRLSCMPLRSNTTLNKRVALISISENDRRRPVGGEMPERIVSQAATKTLPTELNQKKPAVEVCDWAKKVNGQLQSRSTKLLTTNVFLDDARPSPTDPLPLVRLNYAADRF
eukprot:125591-Prorocentrum_minimum.AAC.2